MGLFENVKQLFSQKQKNDLLTGRELANSFLRNGNRNKPLVEDWSKIIISDKELYTGYSYAAINVRANMFAKLATNCIETSTKEGIKIPSDTFTHPYIDLIDTSKSFTNYMFWYTISTYLDLEGVYYLMAVRNIGDADVNGIKRIGEIQYFKLMNPYNVRRIINPETAEVGGYVESKYGLIREIPKEMIIEIRKLNPFSETENFAITDAAKEYQYTLKQAGDYTRHSLKNNMSAPGIVSTDVLLEPEQFQNFVARVTNQEKGLPLFGNGAGAINWDAMQIDIDKASLNNINEINRSTLFAVSGVSKTLMGIEESGTTRETSRVQKELCLENHIVPQLQLVVDALNQDYKNTYEKEYSQYEATIEIDNPIEEDVDIELKETTIQKADYDLFTAMVDKGYDELEAAQFVDEEIDLADLTTPKKPDNPTLPIPPTPDMPMVDTPLTPEKKPVKPVVEPKPKKDTKKPAGQ